MTMRLRFCESEIDYWANIYMEYQTPKGQAREQKVIGIRDGIQERRSLTEDELHKVAYWKTRNIFGRADLTLGNCDVLIKKVTKRAFTPIDDFEKLQSLTKLQGVGKPVASAILHLYDKEQYPILDPHALWSAGLEWKRRNSYPRGLWLEYIAFCRDIADRKGIEIRTLDRALWRYSYDSKER